MPAGGQERKYNEGKYYSKRGKLLRKEKKIPGYLWGDIKMNVIGKKDDLPIHFCDKCDLPIKIYGRIIPCKHAFCYDCANLYDKNGCKICPGCSYPVRRIEKHKRGSLFTCSAIHECKRTYSSQKSLQAHIKHCNKRAGKHVSCTSLEKVRPRIDPPQTEISEIPKRLQDEGHRSYIPPEQHTMMPPPTVPHMLHKHYNWPPKDIQAPPKELSPSPPFPIQWETVSIFTRKDGKIITEHIQKYSNSGAKKPSPPDYSPEYQGQPVVSYPDHNMPRKQHYAQPLSPSSTVNHPMPYPPQDVGTPNLVSSQVPALTTTSDPSPGFVIVQGPLFMKFLLPPILQSQNGNPSESEFAFHHYNLNFLPQSTESQETLSPRLTQRDATDRTLWLGWKVLPPPSLWNPPSSNLHRE
ncbi:E3 ubiquitin-protein ligase CBLL2 [Callithrix jacchus]|uniref:E3 ubiquitin-protein ligase CBLL2 n=1 Tax=Callithrix jacchus TaxID=9483 RepID=UPI0004F04F26|nr:E3 ubiquitin-protein ligase CBLL2 [Callithrix jacchus]